MPATLPSAETRLSRRDFLGMAGKALLALSGLLAAGGMLRFLGYRPAPRPPTEFDLGPATQFSPGSQTVVAEASAVVLNTAQGLVAFSLICPHLGCTVQSRPEGFACPCHGSCFDARGGALRGPADRGLRQLRVEQNAAGHLILHTD